MDYDDPVDWSSVGSPGIADNVIIADDEPCIEEVIPVMESSSGELVFDFLCDPESVEIRPGDVVVGSDHGGYLREVISIEYTNYSAVATTRQAQLADVILDGGFYEEVSFDQQARGTINFDGKELYDGSIGDADFNLLVERGQISVNPELTLAAEFGFLSLKNADVVLSVDVDADLELLASISNGMSLGDSVTLGQVNYPFAFAAGPVPVVGVLQLQLNAGFDVSAEAEASASIGMEVDPFVRVGLKYREGDWVTVEEKEFDAQLVGPEFNLGGKLGAKVKLEVEAKVMLYGAVGPSFAAGPYLRAEAEAECYDLDWSAYAGAELRAAINLDIFVFDLEKSWTFTPFEAEIGSGAYNLAVPIGTNCEGQEPPGCSPFEALSCGETVFGSTSDPEFSTTELDGYPIAVGNYAAPEFSYSFVASQAGPVKVGFVDPSPTLVNHDIFILDGSSDQCVSSQAVAWGLNYVTFDPTPGKTYFIVVDGYDGDSGAFLLNVDCDP